AVPAWPARAWPGARDRTRLRLGRLSVYLVRAGEQLQRFARGGVRAGGCARRLLAARTRHVRGIGRPHEVRAARARSVAVDARLGGTVPARPYPGTDPVRAGLPCHCGGRVGACPDPRLAAHDLQAHSGLPVQSRIALLDLGALRQSRLPAGGGSGRCACACPVACGAPAPRRSDRPRGRGRGRAGSRAARHRTLVLSLHTLVLRLGDARPARAVQLACAGAGRAIRICSIESARSGLVPRTSTPISQGSSLEVSKRTGICVTSASTACSRLTPITPPRGPVMPTSVM